MAVTTHDIAQHLGLSQSTVSRILSGAAGHRAAASTRERVLAAARDLGYRPNAVARSLRRGRTEVIGLYTGHDYDARNEFLGTVLGGLQRACERQRLDLMLFSAYGGRAPEAMMTRLHDGRIDGLLVHTTTDDPIVPLLAETDLPVVAVADALPGLPSATADDERGMALLIDHLWERGYRRYRMVVPRQSLVSVARRQAAFLAAMAGHPEADGAVLTVTEEDGRVVLPVLAPDTVACCWNDRTAYDLLRACREAGMRVPQEVAVAGFDGFLDEKLPARALLTVACPWDLVAEAALDQLSRIIDGQSVDAEVRLPVRLVPGDTA